MTEEAQGRHRKRRRLWLALLVAAVLLAVLTVPPFLSLSRYKNQITRLISASLGRPVRMSSVELRLLPRPGFVLNDLAVEEDPGYGAEPVLHANTVTATIRMLSLWRGRIEISRISVDEASLNLVRAAQGRWNLDSLFRTAATNAQPGAGKTDSHRALPLPYLEATHLRINIKNGAEKLPYSLIDSDLSFWQEEPGDWRIRVRGQPARTDVSLDLADTGVLRLEASMRQAPELREVPVHLDLQWREAQLGQLARLVIGSDPGWRGDLTGELHLDGTGDSAEIKTRLRATGVHRAEFAPAAAMDFDANCGFVYHYSSRVLEKLACDSPLGDGQIHLEGELPGEGGQPRFSVELVRVPVAAGLDALRTVRSGFVAGLEAQGSISGKMTYAGNAPESSAEKRQSPRAKARPTEARKASAGNERLVAQRALTGSFTVEGFQLSGDRLSSPIHVARLVLEPVTAPDQQSGQAQGHAQDRSASEALTTTINIPAGGAVPLTVTAQLALSGYQVTVHGQAALVRARELAHVTGVADTAALNALAGDAATLDLSAVGPWMAVEKAPLSSVSPATIGTDPATGIAAGGAMGDRLSGTVTLHNANWKADYLASHVEIALATLRLDTVGGNGEARWDPVNFSYGPLKGTATLDLPVNCEAAQPCAPHFQVQFGALDASTLQAAILGAREPGTLLSALIAHLSPANTSAAPTWPVMEGKVSADSLIMGPVTLTRPSASLRILADGAEITDLTAGLLGGRVRGGGTLQAAGAGQDTPAYSLQGRFEKLNPAAVGELLGLRWSGGVFDADGKIELSGFTGKDLATSAKGTLHFEWRHGAMNDPGDDQEAASHGARVSPEPVRFDNWTANAAIDSGKITLQQNQMVEGKSTHAVQATVTLGQPPTVTFGGSGETQAER